MKDLESVRRERKAFSMDCPQTSLWYLNLSTIPTFRLSWTSHVSLSNTNVCCCNPKGRLKPFPYRSNLSPQRFLKECAAADCFRISFELSPTAYNAFRGMNLHQMKHFFFRVYYFVTNKFVQSLASLLITLSFILFSICTFVLWAGSSVGIATD